MEKVIHYYDDNAGILKLACGREISVNPRQFTCVDEAVERLTAMARKRKYIRSSESIFAYV